MAAKKIRKATDEPLTVSVELGATIPLPGEDTYGNIRPLVRIAGIRPDLDVKTQLAEALETAHTAFVAIDGELEVQISDMVAASSEESKVGLRDSLAELLKWKKTYADPSIRAIAEKVKKEHPEEAKG